MTKRLFGAEESSAPPAQQVTLVFDTNLYPMPDSRPGKQNTTWHREIRTSVDLTLDFGSQVQRVTGYARFYVVRGDSAALPSYLGDRVVRDSTRWYIERWEDETLEGASVVAGPFPQTSRARALGAVAPLGVRMSRTGGKGLLLSPSSATSTATIWLTWGRAKDQYSYR